MTLHSSNRRRFGLCTSLVIACFAESLQAAAPAEVTYTYDDLARLRTGQFNDGRQVDYQYDPAGNRTTMTSGTAPTMTIGAAASVSEGGSLSFPVTRTGSHAQNVTVSCVPQDGTAKATGTAPFADYVTTPQPLVFYPSDPSPSTKNCVIVTKTDSYYEATQTLTATLQNASAGAVIGSPASAAGAILDANGGPAFSVAGSSSTEGSALSFTLTKSGLTELTHNVSYATANGSATAADNDYTPIGLTPIAFASGQTTAVIPVTSIADSKYENAESVLLNLSSATNGAGISVASASGTLSNDDAPPAIVIDDAARVSEGSAATFVVRNIGNTNTALTHSISWSTANATAAAGSDYVAASGSVTFAAGETAKSVQVQTIADGVHEGVDETFVVNLSPNGSTQGAVINDSQGIGTIADNDPGNRPPIAQGDTGTVVVMESGTFYVLRNDSDPDGDPLTITSAVKTTSAPLSFMIGCGATCIDVTFAPVKGNHSIRYTISDNRGGTASTNLSITVR